MGINLGKRTEEFTRRLEEEHRQVVDELGRLREHLKAEVDADVDEADPNLVEREKFMALVHNLERKLESIDWAMRRLKEGRYGTCERCGDTIDPGRLEIFPETTLCITCKSVLEREARLKAGYGNQR